MAPGAPRGLELSRLTSPRRVSHEIPALGWSGRLDRGVRPHGDVVVRVLSPELRLAFGNSVGGLSDFD
jgi:hypothetical protein